jgi:hypothetical protein
MMLDPTEETVLQVLAGVTPEQAAVRPSSAPLPLDGCEIVVHLLSAFVFPSCSATTKTAP